MTNVQEEEKPVEPVESLQDAKRSKKSSLEDGAVARLKEFLLYRRSRVRASVEETTGSQLKGKRRVEATSMLGSAQEQIAGGADVTETQKNLAAQLTEHGEEQVKDKFTVGREIGELTLELERFGKLQVKLAEKYPEYFQINESSGVLNFDYNNFEKFSDDSSDSSKIKRQIKNEISQGLGAIVDRIKKLKIKGEGPNRLDLLFKQTGEKRIALVFLENLTYYQHYGRGRSRLQLVGGRDPEGLNNFDNFCEVYDALVENFRLLDREVTGKYLQVEEQMSKAQACTFFSDDKQLRQPTPSILSNETVASRDKDINDRVGGIIIDRLRRGQEIKLRDKNADPHQFLLTCVDAYIAGQDKMDGYTMNAILEAVSAFFYDVSPEKANDLEFVVSRIFEHQVLHSSNFGKDKEGVPIYFSYYHRSNVLTSRMAVTEGEKVFSAQRPLMRIIFSRNFPIILKGIKSAVETVCQKRGIASEYKAALIRDICSNLTKSWSAGEGDNRPDNPEDMLKKMEKAVPTFKSLLEWQKSASEVKT